MLFDQKQEKKGGQKDQYKSEEERKKEREFKKKDEDYVGGDYCADYISVCVGLYECLHLPDVFFRHLFCVLEKLGQKIVQQTVSGISL